MLGLLAKTCETAWRLELSRADVDDWLSNFSGDVHPRAYERQLALWLLLNFVYYNYDEVMHLSRVLYRQFLHNHLERQSFHSGAEVRLAATELLRRVLFYQLGRPGESGGFILYLFRQANSLPISNFVTSRDRTPDKIDTVVFVDDACLSGSQAQKYLKHQTQDFKEANRALLTLPRSNRVTACGKHNGPGRALYRRAFQVLLTQGQPLCRIPAPPIRGPRARTSVRSARMSREALGIQW